MNKKILIFSIAYPFSAIYKSTNKYQPFVGGAEFAIKEITDRIDDIQFDMVTLRFDNKLPKFERVGNINVYRIGFAKKNPSLGDSLKFPLMLNKYLFVFLAFIKAQCLHKKNDYSAIWGMMAAYAGFVALFFKKKNNRIPFLLTLQEGDDLEYIAKRASVLKGLFKQIFTKADYIQCISNYLADWAMEMGAKHPIEVVPNGVDTYKFQILNFKFQKNIKYQISPACTDGNFKKEFREKLGISEDDKVIITASRLVEKNGVEDLIRAMGKFQIPNFKLLIAGSGKLEDKLKKLVQELNLQNNVLFLGQISQDELPKYLWASDIFCRPSLSEGLGNSFLEAMATGVPVIATPVGGIPDFLIDGETGIFCKVKNPESIADAVMRLLNDKILYDKIATNGLRLVEEKYDWDRISLQMKEIYNKVKSQKSKVKNASQK
ncbi:MAG: glycosyltransferase family 4 protein [bacterium]